MSAQAKPSTYFSHPTLLDFEVHASPYFTSQHHKYRLHVRDFYERVMAPYHNKFDKWASNEEVPDSEVRAIQRLIVKHTGIHMFPFGFAKWQGHEDVEWDPFFYIIFLFEITYGRTCFDWGHQIHSICIPPLLHYGTNAVHRRVIEEVSRGEKFISLAISEPRGGSDVAQIETSATLTPDGKNYVVTGSKYWITGGTRADYFVTLVRTANTGDRFGVTLILIPRTKRVFSSKMKLQGSGARGTAIITFAKAVVPAENVIGEVNRGFLPLMRNFNTERFFMCVNMVAQSRLCVHEAIKWARERETFGKKLITHQVIRHKIADMSRQILATYSFLERVAYQLKMQKKTGQRDKSLPRNTALLKVHCSKLMQHVTVECSQILGGRSYVKGGRGGIIDRAYRLVRAQAISGGSEEILSDFAVRSGLKLAKL